jgi:hypothetical protein
MRTVGKPALARSSRAGEADYQNKPRKPWLFLPSKCSSPVKYRSPVFLLSNTVWSGASRKHGWRRPPQLRDQPDSPGAHCRLNITHRGDRSGGLLTRQVAALIFTDASGMVDASAGVGIAEHGPLARVSERGHLSRTGCGRVRGFTATGFRQCTRWPMLCGVREAGSGASSRYADKLPHQHCCLRSCCRAAP